MVVVTPDGRPIGHPRSTRDRRASSWSPPAFGPAGHSRLAHHRRARPLGVAVRRRRAVSGRGGGVAVARLVADSSVVVADSPVGSVGRRRTVAWWRAPAVPPVASVVSELADPGAVGCQRWPGGGATQVPAAGLARSPVVHGPALVLVLLVVVAVPGVPELLSGVVVASVEASVVSVAALSSATVVDGAEPSGVVVASASPAPAPPSESPANSRIPVAVRRTAGARVVACWLRCSMGPHPTWRSCEGGWPLAGSSLAVRASMPAVRRVGAAGHGGGVTVRGADGQFGVEIGRIGPGLCVLVGVTHTDDEAVATKLAEKLWTLRVFDDDAGVMNRSAADLGAEILVVSQFTLYGDTVRRPAAELDRRRPSRARRAAGRRRRRRAARARGDRRHRALPHRDAASTRERRPGHAPARTSDGDACASDGGGSRAGDRQRHEQQHDRTAGRRA